MRGNKARWPIHKRQKLPHFSLLLLVTLLWGKQNQNLLHLQKLLVRRPHFLQSPVKENNVRLYANGGCRGYPLTSSCESTHQIQVRFKDLVLFNFHPWLHHNAPQSNTLIYQRPTLPSLSSFQWGNRERKLRFPLLRGPISWWPFFQTPEFRQPKTLLATLWVFRLPIRFHWIAMPI